LVLLKSSVCLTALVSSSPSWEGKDRSCHQGKLRIKRKNNSPDPKGQAFTYVQGQGHPSRTHLKRKTWRSL
jgi:hypothetical protein